MPTPFRVGSNPPLGTFIVLLLHTPWRARVRASEMAFQLVERPLGQMAFQLVGTGHFKNPGKKKGRS